MDDVDFEESDGEYGDLSHISDSKNRNLISLKIHFAGRLVIMEPTQAILWNLRGFSVYLFKTEDTLKNLQFM